MAAVQSSYAKAKNSVSRKGSSVDDLKLELRKQFKSRLRDMRCKSVDSCRNLVAEVNEGYRELVASLESQLHMFDLIQPDTVLETLKQIQNELLEQLANEEITDYESFIQDEIEDMITCKICEQYCEKDICDTCSQKHFSD